MLHRVLQEIETAQGSINLGELSRKLGVEQSALEGMIQVWVRKGRLKDDSQSAGIPRSSCGSHGCGHACPGPQACPLIMKLPRTYTLLGGGSQ